uniref:Methyltransferase type 11 domain-containing protein n=1 Tax=Leptobrachium leishanense TaxID=445787 RepID=A0A8C5WK93_9ANUR
MDFAEAQGAILSLLGQVSSDALPKVIHWMKTSTALSLLAFMKLLFLYWYLLVLFDAKEHCRHLSKRGIRYPFNFTGCECPRGDTWKCELEDLTTSNNDIILKSISEDLRSCLPVEAMVGTESRTMQVIRNLKTPTVHVDAFLYDEEAVDSLCAEGKMSRNYCLSCGSKNTAPLDFLSHSFSLPELRFLFQNALPDLAGKTLLDVGSRLGAVLYVGYVYSSASHLYGVEMNAEFCNLQEKIIQKYQFEDRIKVYQADICNQKALLQEADVVVLNNVFEYFLEKEEQAKAWTFLNENLRKKGSLLITVPTLKESLGKLQLNINVDHWVEEVDLDLDHVYLREEVDEQAHSDIHLYCVR